MRHLVLLALWLTLATQIWAGGVAFQVADLNSQASIWDPDPVQPSPFRFAELDGEERAASSSACLPQVLDSACE